MKFLGFFLVFVLLTLNSFSQDYIWITGQVFSASTNQPLNNVSVNILENTRSTKTDKKGFFKLESQDDFGEYILELKLKGYLPTKIPILIETNENLNLGVLFLKTDVSFVEQNFTTIDIGLFNNEEIDDASQPLLRATKDPIIESAAFNWSATYFKLRGLGSEHSKVLINGIEMNKLQNNRPNWSNWTGLNDVLRNQENSNYLFSNSLSFGGLNGITNINMNALSFKKRTKISFASTSRTFSQRLMLTHHSGLLKNNWAYSFAASRSKANEGFIEGTSLTTTSFFSSIAKKINTKHSLNLNFIYTPVKRGKSAPITDEVFEIKGRNYNPYWGIQNNDIRNSRVKEVNEPIVMVTHEWKPHQKWTISNNILLQYGFIKNSRLDYTGTTAITANNEFFYEGVGTNPDPTYYQKLPSYFLREEGNENFENAFLADREIRQNGQINWRALYNANQLTEDNATYILFNDVTNDFLFSANSIWDFQYSEKSNFNGTLNFKSLNSNNYAEVDDLLGGNGYLDVDAFSNGLESQNDLRNPNRIVYEDDKFRYNYKLRANEINGFAQYSSSFKNWNISGAINFVNKSFQRIGRYENGYFPGSLSLGKSEKLNLWGWGLKTNLLYQLNPKLYIGSNIFFNESPNTLNQSFINVRQSNSVNPILNNEAQFGSDLNLNYRFDWLNMRLSCFYNQIQNGTKNSFFYSEDIAGLGRVENSGFFQELVTNIDKRFLGIEYGVEAKITDALALKFTTSIGDYRYTNNPNLSLYTNDAQDSVFDSTSFLKNYKIGNGPQQVYGLGFSYRDPDYWWFSTQLNYYKNSFLSVSPFLRTSNFTTDIDGFPIIDYNPEIAKELLAQKEFAPYFLWNAIGGKSWKKKKKYFGFTLGIQNILNQIFRTGGFEQSRNSNYNALNEDQVRELPLFGPKYWYGTGSTFYLNTYLIL